MLKTRERLNMLDLFGTLPEKKFKTEEMLNMLDMLDVWGETPPLEGRNLTYLTFPGFRAFF